MKARVEMSKVPCFYIVLEELTCYFISSALNIITFLTFCQRSLNVSAFIQEIPFVWHMLRLLLGNLEEYKVECSCISKIGSFSFGTMADTHIFTCKQTSFFLLPLHFIDSV